MSAFVIGADCMTKIVRALASVSTQPGFLKPVPLLERFNDMPTSTKDFPAMAGRALFLLNIAAVQSRYPDTIDDPDGMPGPIDDDDKSIAPFLAKTFTCERPTAPLSSDELAASVKCVQCLLYQLAEGSVPETPLYQELDKALLVLCEEIVRRMPAYRAQDWG